MQRLLKVYNVTNNTSIDLNFPYFNTLLEAQQHLLACYNEVVQKHITANSTQLLTDIFEHAITPILSSYRVSAFIATTTGGAYNVNTGEFLTPSESGFVKYYYYFNNDILESSDFFNNIDIFKIGTTEFALNSGVMEQRGSYGRFPYNYMSTDTSRNKAVFRFRNAFNSNYGITFPVGTGGFTYLKMPCVYSDTSNNLYFGIINLALNQSPSNGISPWSSNYYVVYNYSIPITEFNEQLPNLSDDVTEEIDTDTGESETQDSEENVGGDGHVTLINNVVNYDNFTPDYSRINTGFITPYEISNNELTNLHSFLYSESILDMIKNYFAGDASKAIIDLFNIPVAPTVEAVSSDIKIGVISSGASANAITNETVTFDFGSIDLTVNGYYSNTFMDLAPFNQYSIYLPFIGFRNLNTNDIRSINDDGFKIYLKYIIDVLTGEFVAVVEADHNNAAVDNKTGTVTTAKLTKQVINVFNGSMRTDIPLSYRNPLQGIMPIISGLAGSIGSISGTITSSANAVKKTTDIVNTSVGGLNSIGNVNNALIPRGDNISGSVGNLTLKKAFIINQEAPKYIRTGKSNQLAGYPVYKFLKLNDERGFVKVRNVIASGFGGTAHEQERVVELLKGGVWCK